MRIFQVLKNVITLLEPYDERWAICGGVAASLYRETPRFTGDIDIALVDGEDTSAEKIASDILKKLGYTPKSGSVTDQNGILIKKQALVIGREESEGKF